MRNHPLFTVVVCGILSAAPVLADTPAATFRPGDTFDLKLAGVPPELAQEFNATYTVSQGGAVNVPLIRETKVGGLTPPQAEKLIQDKLVANHVFTSPSVNINAVSNSRQVVIGGGVRVPQRLTWSPDLTAFAAIQLAGGPGDFAGKDVKLIRGGKITVFDLRKMENDPARDPKLLPGDLIILKN